MADGLEKQAGFASQVASFAALPVAIQAGGGIKSVARNHGIKGAVSSLNREGFKNLAGNLSNDTFTKSIRLANEYDAYKGIAKKAKKLENKAAKIAKKGDISALDKAKNIFKKEGNKITAESVNAAKTTAQKTLQSADDALKQGKSAIEATAKGSAEAAKAATTSVKGVLKSELGSKLNIGFAALFTFIPTFKENAIPAFKNDGFFAGLKETAKALGFAGADLSLSAVATAIGGAIGGTIGTAICPGAGTAIGRTIVGGVASAIVSSKASEMALKAGKYSGKKAEENEQLAQANKLDMNF